MYFVPMGQIRGEGRGEGFMEAWSIQFNEGKIDSHTINLKTHISSVTVDNCKNNYR